MPKRAKKDVPAAVPTTADKEEDVETKSAPTTAPENDVDVEELRKELKLLKRKLQSAETVDAFVSVARAADRIASKAANKPYVEDVRQVGRSRGDNEQTLTVRGLHKELTWIKVKEALTKLKVEAMHVDKALGWDLAIVQVKDEAAKTEAVRLLNGQRFEGQVVSVELGAPSEEDMARLKRTQNDRGTKRPADARGGGGRGRGRRAQQ